MKRPVEPVYTTHFYVSYSLAFTSKLFCLFEQQTIGVQVVAIIKDNIC